MIKGIVMKFEHILKLRTLVSDGALGTLLQENGLPTGQFPGEMVDVMEEFRNHTDLPLLAQANSRLPETIYGEIVYNETLEQRIELAPILLGKQVNIIGGCCGINPGHIKAIRNTVVNYSSPK